VHVEDWRYGDWSTLPDKYHFIAIWSSCVPKDWNRDYVGLLEKLKDPELGRLLCSLCCINRAQESKKEIERRQKYWQENGGEEAKKKFYEECGEPRTSEFWRRDAMREVERRLYNEISGPENRKCNVINYFQCPNGDERQTLTNDGCNVTTFWQHIQWYDEHWNGSTSLTPSESQRKWYHTNEPPIIDVKSFDDIIKALNDGRIEKIILEHERYMKDTGAKAWNL